MSTAHQRQFNGRALEMLQTGEGADVVIEVQLNDGLGKTEEFNVHKFMLIANSDVFSAMFRHKNTKECRESRIQIKDSAGTDVRQMLYYMYTGGQLPDDYNASKDAMDLMKIANKYQIKSLMDLIEQQLTVSLSLTNVFDRLELAHLCQIDALKAACGKLIRRNLRKVKTNAKWIELKKKWPDLAFSILEEFTDERDRDNNTYSSPASPIYNPESPSINYCYSPSSPQSPASPPLSSPSYSQYSPTSAQYSP